jgi:hypothetical protein
MAHTFWPAPARKYELLGRFHETFGLQWQITSSTSKPDHGLGRSGFVPELSNLEAMMDQATVFLAVSARVPA